MIGVGILSLYGLVTIIGGFAVLRSSGAVDISRLQAAVFTLIGMAVIVVAVLSFTKSVGLVWLVLICVASLLSRVWNGWAMGRVHALHILSFSGILTLGIVLT